MMDFINNNGKGVKGGKLKQSFPADLLVPS